MNKPKLTENDFIDAAKILHCGVAEVKTVAFVESRGQGFYADGFPIILFERHKFHEYTGGRFDKDYPEISNPNPGGYGKAGPNQKRKFDLAFSLDPNAAMKACSWGKFQILGSNFKVCGFSSVGAFVDAMKTSEGEHLKAFIKFVIGNALDVHLQSRNWEKFAKGYNGRKYREGNYDGKLAAAYEKFRYEKVSPVPVAGFAVPENPSPVRAETSAGLPAALSADSSADNTDTGTEKTATATQETAQGSITAKSTQLNQLDVNQDAPVEAPKPQGLKAKLTTGIGTLLGGTILYDKLGAVAGIQFSIHTLYILAFIIVLAFLGFCLWAVLDVMKSNKRVELEAMANTDINRKNIAWVKPENL